MTTEKKLTKTEAKQEVLAFSPKTMKYNRSLELAKVLELKLSDNKKATVFEALATEQAFLKSKKETPPAAKKNKVIGAPAAKKETKANPAPKAEKLSIVIPFLGGPKNGLELKYALRSIEKNLKEDCQVILIGEKPDWVKNVIHVEVERVTDVDYMSFMDVCNKIRTACELKEIGKGFVYMYDDTFFIAPTNLNHIQQLKALEDMSKIKKWFQTTTASKKWCDVMAKTLKTLQSKNLPIFNYETHCPRYFDTEAMKKLFGQYFMHTEPYQISTLYYNTYHSKRVPVLLAPWGAGFKLGIYANFPFEKLKSKLRKNKVLNIAKPMINDPDMLKFLEYLFPEASKFEK